MYQDEVFDEKGLEEISCNRGRCWKTKKHGTWFDGMFVKGDIVHEINKDLWRKNLYG